MKARMWGPEYGGLRRNYPPIEFLPSLFRFGLLGFKNESPWQNVLLASHRSPGRILLSIYTNLHKHGTTGEKFRSGV